MAMTTAITTKLKGENMNLTRKELVATQLYYRGMSIDNAIGDNEDYLWFEDIKNQIMFGFPSKKYTKTEAITIADEMARQADSITGK